ncbi:hypothetical protein FQN54_004175 [Arachnomyces sp. PD_36]|nr:hypothetical protein FQN54_004175 [Arachnomyces sp. PD_36]
MIDHVLGRPSSQFRKIQVLAVVSFWSVYLLRGDKNGPPGIRSLSSRLSKRMTPWQAMVLTLLWLYISRNFAKLVNLESPEPLANLYTRSYFRATWVTTALDAGFWTAMKIKRKWLRDLASLIFSGYYLLAAERADEKVRRIRATLTVDHLRVSWNKATTPYLSFFSRLLRPRFTRYPPRALRIPRPRESSYQEPIEAWLYFDGPLGSLRDHSEIVLDIPGGGFVAMNPRTSDDKLLAWAGKTGVPVLSLDYKKAPEYPYPYALNECYDAYHTIISSHGRCIGLSGNTRPRVVISGDSAGGNLATGLTLMILQSGSTDSRRWKGEHVLPPPDGLVLIYPSLDMNIGSWMSQEQMSLIRDKDVRKTNRNVLRRKSEDYHKLTPKTSRILEEEADNIASPDYFSHKNGQPVETAPKRSSPDNLAIQAATLGDHQPAHVKTRLAVSSMISYFGDRIITPEMMRAMIILYVGPHNRPDFSTDFLLSPLLAPEELLARFPKTYFLTGERDPLVDDTVIFAGRIRQAKLHRFRERQDLGLEKSKLVFNEKDHVEVTLIPGISHGFLNFVSVFPEGWRQIFRCAKWIQDIFTAVQEIERKQSAMALSQSQRFGSGHTMTSGPIPRQGNGDFRHHNRVLTGGSSIDEDHPLEMSMSKPSNVGFDVEPLKDVSNIPGNDRTSHAGYTAQKQPSERTVPEEREPSTDGTLTDGLFDRRRALSLSLSLPVDEEDRLEEGEDDIEEQEKRRMIRRETSFTSLPSEEDLLVRRMKGLAGGLMGIGEEARTP